jgi:hypothetical protein
MVLKIKKMKVSINQPYFFPYLPFYQMVNYSDVFVSLDSVNFCKKKFINRNVITDNNGRKINFTLPIRNLSQNKKINQSEIFNLKKTKDSFIKKLKLTYGFRKSNLEVFDVVDSCFTSNLISEVSTNSIKNVFNYLGIEKSILLSSESFKSYDEYKKEIKIYGICHELNCTDYINLPNGNLLYDKEDFTKKEIKLSFISNDLNYNTSILDVLFREDKQQIIGKLNNHIQ